MAREESDREDILAEAVALIDRVQFRCDWFPDDCIVIGFRRNSAVSLFLGQDEVYHFNDTNQLRRGYWHGTLLKAESGRIVQMVRQRNERETMLRSRQLDAEQQQQVIDRLQQRLRQLGDSLRVGEMQVEGEVSGTGADVCQRWLDWRMDLPPQLRIAASPRVSDRL